MAGWRSAQVEPEIVLHRIHAFVTSFGKACRDNERAAALKKKQAEMEKAAAAKAEAEAKAAAEGKSVAEATGARVLPMRRVMPAPGTRWHREKPSGKLAVPAASRLLRRASRVAPPASRLPRHSEGLRCIWRGSALHAVCAHAACPGCLWLLACKTDADSPNRVLPRWAGLMMSSIQGSLRRGEFKQMKALQAQMSEELASRMQRRRSQMAVDD